jgi:1-deoxy-D-xylulose-5-phosphate reductoisomerase
MKKTISILGSTGSIGRQALEVTDSLSEKFEIYGLAAGDNLEIFLPQIQKYKPEIVSVKNQQTALELKKHISDTEILWGDEGLIEIAQNGKNNTVLIAVAGMAGLYPTLAAINNGVDVALANKETLVSAGNIVMERAKANNVNVLPVDSEHSAIHQCIKDPDQVKKLILTASGGPFRDKTVFDMENATLEQTLAHPKWSMGSKITVDSATLMNKGLEVIEAHMLFGTDYENIEVVIHPQSIMHSAVEYVDGSTVAQLGVPSMHLPIQYALTYPDRFKGLVSSSLNFADIKKLEFEEPDFQKFPCLALAYEAGKKGGTYPAVLNAANEEAVYAFIEGKIKLTDISKIVEKVLEKHESKRNPDLSDIIEADKLARHSLQELIL